jgi:hypothetical protein
VILRFISLACVFLLSACAGKAPFEKQAVNSSELVRPPWEALVKAGPGAENELDLETLNGPGGQLTPDGPPMPPPSVATPEPSPPEEPPVVEEPVQKAEPAPAQKDKKQVVIKSVAVPRVEGAKGKGNAELTNAMREVLRASGWPVIDAPRNDAISIKGRVSVADAVGPTQTVKIKWVVQAPDGKVLGNIDQANDVPAGSLDGGWGENAKFASEAAAEGIFKLIQGYR